ncbi:MAG TPA: hypothetical protein VIL85_27605 [Thermomicrobiales bacterium]|jgi:hypothetical protein
MPGDELALRRARSRAAWRERLRVAHEGWEERGEERLDLDPRSAYELLTRQMVAGLSEELREIRQRVNGLLFVTVTAVIADVVIRLTR